MPVFPSPLQRVRLLSYNVQGGIDSADFVDQTAHLAAGAGFPFWYKQVNRDLGRIARHSNGFLSRIQPRRVASYPLPGLPGRGALVAEFGGDEGLKLCMLHLALGSLARRRQLGFVAELLTGAPRIAVMACKSPRRAGIDAR